ncbi:MAG: sulfite exporter TauE/SafE family protein [Rhodospirillales bacterium]|nr:sulfite exporter TauE/SafE family protein [Rhodospirillales bacterium]
MIGAGAVGFGFFAGLLSVLSPCVLPVLPLVLAPAASAHRHGPLALAAGLIAAFVGIGLFVATIGFSMGIGAGTVRAAGAVLLGAAGAVLLSERAQARLAFAASGFGSRADRRIPRFAGGGLGGQFAVGALLGAVWSPCVGPTLGAASVLAAQGKDLAGAAEVMGAFGLGTALPLLAAGMLSRQALGRWRGRMLGAGKTGKRLLGLAALAVSVLILSGIDRMAETALIAVSPAWLTALTSRF